MTRQANHIAIVDDPYFRVPAKWNAGANWTIDGTGGADAAVASSSCSLVAPRHPIESGNLYHWEVEITGYSAGAISVSAGGVVMLSLAVANGLYSGNFTSSAATALAITGVGFTGTVARVVLVQHGHGK